MKKLFFAVIFPALLMVGFSCATNNIRIDHTLQRFFDSLRVTGTFAMYDNKLNEITIYDSSVYKKRYCPASTFKIVNSLIGIETGIISDENMVIKWDGVKRQFDSWNQDLTMKQAFKYSAVPYYQEVARRIGRDTMHQWIDSIGYGNKDISGPIDSFWLNQKLLISPDEQLGLMKKLYFDQLPFKKRSMNIVKDAMLQEDNTSYRLSYKTGWAYDSDKAFGWVVGWIEENRHPYFFVLYIQSTDSGADIPAKRMKILRGILREKGFFEGKK